jgi:hypothetical protein
MENDWSSRSHLAAGVVGGRESMLDVHSHRLSRVCYGCGGSFGKSIPGFPPKG